MSDIGKFLHTAKTKILGKNYSVSFAFIKDAEMQKLNKTYRKKNKTTDILSFPLSTTEGEILISKKETVKKAKLFGLKTRDYLHYLLIHGLLHLKGLTHSSKMESKEREFCRVLQIPIPHFLLLHEETNHSRNRRGNVRSTGNRR